MYETKISDARWIAYDIPGNLGWIAYFTGLILIFLKKPDFMGDGVMRVMILVSVIPAIMMLIGLVELINERICKLDRILSKKRLYRGFGMLYFGGIAGTVLSVLALIYGLGAEKGNLTYIWLMLCGGVLCAVFAGLLFKGYQRID